MYNNKEWMERVTVLAVWPQAWPSHTPPLQSLCLNSRRGSRHGVLFARDVMYCEPTRLHGQVPPHDPSSGIPPLLQPLQCLVVSLQRVKDPLNCQGLPFPRLNSRPLWGIASDRCRPEDAAPSLVPAEAQLRLPSPKIHMFAI